MRFDTLNDWLSWQQSLHPAGIELGLDRVRDVLARMHTGPIASTLLTVAGTNGKGSTVACYETWLQRGGHRVASYTSPHLLRYNERVKLDLQPVDDLSLCRAFDRVDAARHGVVLTYFEFGTLAALQIIADYQPDFAILEVGLGGRLDAVNVLDPDLAHITPIGLDHQEWLGNTREQIGREKAGILRPHAMAICNDRKPPQSVLEVLVANANNAQRLGVDYDFEWLDRQRIAWHSDELSIELTPPLTGLHQAENVSGVLAGLNLLGCLQGLSEQSIAAGFEGVTCAGRLQAIDTPLRAPMIVDVGHNVDAARALADYLRNQATTGRVVVLLGMLGDKDVEGFTAVLSSLVSEWWCIGLSTERGLSAQQLSERITSSTGRPRVFANAEFALAYAMSTLDNQDILLVTGSFMTVEAVLKTPFVKSA